jgi:hypothetical protein
MGQHHRTLGGALALVLQDEMPDVEQVLREVRMLESVWRLTVHICQWVPAHPCQRLEVLMPAVAAG